jgi:flagellin
MRIRDNWLALVSWRSFASAGARVDRSIGRLASGLSINSASDDVAGHAISERLISQFRSLTQATRNAMDGLSLVQTGEAALSEVTTLLQRGRELSLQATNGVWTPDEKKAIQTEINHLLAEIDRISDVTVFNGNRLLSPFPNSGLIANIMNGLQSSWLRETERIVKEQYGLIGDMSSLRIVFETNGSEAAWVTGISNAATGKLDNLALHINLSEMDPQGGPDGGEGPIYNDRKVARALTQAILARNANFAYVDDWFKSGAADFIAGRNELLKEDLTRYGAAAVVSAMSDALSGTWVDDSLHRSAAYVAMRYLEAQLGTGAMDDFMNMVKSPGGTVDGAMNSLLLISANDFVTDFMANGAAFLTGLDLNSTDVGGIGGGDAQTVIPNPEEFSQTPLVNFQVNWDIFAGLGAGSGKTLRPMEFVLQVGSKQGDTLSFEIPVISTMTLGLIGVDVVKAAEKAVTNFSTAIQIVTGARTAMGAVQNRLDHIITNNNQVMIAGQASYTRIRDLDFASEMTELTRNQILVSSSGAMLAQANTARQNVMWLLSGVSSQRATLGAMA